MSPVSRKRKKVGGGHRVGPKTPSTTRISQPAVGAPTAAAEAQLLAWICQSWQEMMAGRPANTCIQAVHTIGAALELLGLEYEPVAVEVEVKFPNGTVTLGSERPHWANGHWTGHLGLWLPQLTRFVDPTLYQANRPGTGARIEQAAVLPIDLDTLFVVAFPKDGAIVRYLPVDPASAQSWQEGFTPAMRQQCRASADPLLRVLRDPPDGESRLGSLRRTRPALAARLVERGLLAAVAG